MIYKGVWDNDEAMLELIKVLSIKEIATRFSRSKSTTYAYVEKYNI